MKLKKFFKQDMVKFFLIDVVFFGLLGGVLLYARKKIMDLIFMMSGYAEQVSQLSQIVEEQGIEALSQVEALTSAVEPLMTKLYLTVYFLLPIALFLIWCLTQGVIYNLLNKKKFYDWKALGRFVLFNVPFFVVMFLLIEFMFRQITVGLEINVNMYWVGLIVVILVLILYFMQVAYVFLHKLKMLDGLKKSFWLCVLKFHKLFPLTLVSIFIFLMSFVFLWNILIKTVSSGSGYILSIVSLLVSIFLWGVYRTFLVKFIQKA